MKTVGVLGGMGPAATLDFCERLLRATPAERDQDHLRVLVDNNPHIPDRNDALLRGGPSPAPVMAEMARGLERQGAELIVIPCNTAHAFLPEVRAAVTTPVIDMVAETVALIGTDYPQARRVGLLAVDGCLAAGLYQNALQSAGLQARTFTERNQAEFMTVVYGVKAGLTGEPAQGRMADLARRLVAAGADLILAACTEVPILLRPGALDLPVISATDVLVARTLEAAL